MCSGGWNTTGVQKALQDLCLQPPTGFIGWSLKIAINFKRWQAGNNTFQTSLLCILWTWGHSMTLPLPQPAWAHLGEGLPCTEWHWGYFKGLNLSLQFSALLHRQDQLEAQRNRAADFPRTALYSTLYPDLALKGTHHSNHFIARWSSLLLHRVNLETVNQYICLILIKLLCSKQGFPGIKLLLWKMKGDVCLIPFHNELFGQCSI